MRKGGDMPLQLDHTIVPAHDKVQSAKFIARMFGLTYEGTWGISRRSRSTTH